MNSIEETKAFLKKLEDNELYKKSKSIHKGFQFRQFSNPLTGEFIEGQQIRREDENGLLDGEIGYNPEKTHLVIYNFQHGVLHSENNEPAIQYEGHWEYWNKGMIVKVVAEGGNTEEFWENGAPVRIETNLGERRSKGENI